MVSGALLPLAATACEQSQVLKRVGKGYLLTLPLFPYSPGTLEAWAL